MGQRNPAPVENGGKHPCLSHYFVGISTICLVIYRISQRPIHDVLRRFHQPASDGLTIHSDPREALGGTTEEATFYANRPAGQDPGAWDADVEVWRFFANESNLNQPRLGQESGISHMGLSENVVYP